MIGISALLTVLCVFAATAFHSKHNIRKTSRFMSRINMNFDQSAYSASFLQKLVQRKKFELDNMLRLHTEPDDPIVMRLQYVASQCRFNISNALRRDVNENSELHKISVVVDMKRRSPTVHTNRNIVNYDRASDFASLLARIGVDALMVNTDDLEYGGRPNELLEVTKSLKALNPSNPCPVIAKDIIIHPAQIAQALNEGASGVLLIAAVVGQDLTTLLDASTIMGTEAIVEVHTPTELAYALDVGATYVLVNMWDRLTGKLHEAQAKALIKMIPKNVLALVAGNIRTIERVEELSFMGYDTIVIGRAITEIPDLKKFIDTAHSLVGPPVQYDFGTKGMPWL